MNVIAAETITKFSKVLVLVPRRIMGFGRMVGGNNFILWPGCNHKSFFPL